LYCATQDTFAQCMSSYCDIFFVSRAIEVAVLTLVTRNYSIMQSILSPKLYVDTLTYPSVST